MKITIVGAGYVGLVGAVCFAKQGHNVLAIEKNDDRLNLLKQAISPIYEPNLETILKEVTTNGKLTFSNSLKDGTSFSQVVMLCVGTPQSDDGQADLHWVKEAVEEIAHHASEYKLIIEKSTVPVNSHKKILTWMSNINHTTPFEVASNPEFLREGKAITDFLQPSRIVCGVASQQAKNILEELYYPFSSLGVPLIFTNVASSELIKQAANSFLAMKISYANMLAEFCEKVDANIDDVSRGIGLDERIGSKFLNAGIGFGGSCFPKDLSAFIRTGEQVDLNFGLLRETITINNRQRERFTNKIKLALSPLQGKHITLWGLAFKPDTDDVREAPSIYLVKELLDCQAVVHLYDPEASAEFKRHFAATDRVIYHNDMYQALENSHALVLVTEWDCFLKADYAKVKGLMAENYLFDARNALNSTAVRSHGFIYEGMGR